jgi:hypothetical protein
VRILFSLAIFRIRLYSLSFLALDKPFGFFIIETDFFILNPTGVANPLATDLQGDPRAHIQNPVDVKNPTVLP